MEDSDRIPRILALLGHYWRLYPELRLGQIVGNLSQNGDPYFMEDDAFEAAIRKAIDRVHAGSRRIEIST